MSNRVELHLPEGKTYIAKTFGRETIFAKSVQKGIAARMLEYANDLVKAAYEVDDGPDLDGNGTPDWYLPRATAGKVNIKYDATIRAINPDGSFAPAGVTGCNPTDNSACKCEANRACMELRKYSELPFFMRQAMRDYGLASPTMKGIY